MGDESLFVYLGSHSLLVSSYFVSRKEEGLDIAKVSHKKQGHLIKWKGCVLHKGTQRRE